jgi:hypothetical protein
LSFRRIIRFLIDSVVYQGPALTNQTRTKSIPRKTERQSRQLLEATPDRREKAAIAMHRRRTTSAPRRFRHSFGRKSRSNRALVIASTKTYVQGAALTGISSVQVEPVPRLETRHKR